MNPRRYTRLWFAALVVWSLLLITPGNWFPGAVARAQAPGGIGLGKLLHVGAYAFLAGSAGWLPVALEWRTLIALGLIAHGGLTEWIQLNVPFRDGSIVDWAIDTWGVVLGWLITRRFWRNDAATGP